MHTKRIMAAQAQLLYFQHRLAAKYFGVGGADRSIVTHHHSGHAGGVLLGGNTGTGHAPATQHRGLVAQSFDFVEFVADKQNGTAFAGQLAQGDKQGIDFLRSQY